MEKKIIHLVYASDCGYLRNVAVAIGSAFLWASDRSRLVVDLLAIDIDESIWEGWIEEVMRFLPQDCKIIKHDIEGERFSCLRQWHGSKGAYARLLLPELLHGEAWCIYADVDTLFTADPLELENVYDTSSSIMGHLEYPFKELHEQEVWFKERNLPFDRCKYFCSGFVLMNLDWFRKNDAGARALELLRQFPDAPLVDQEALNAICVGTSKALPSEWGCFGCEAFAEGRPKAIHYPGHNPWKFLDNMFPDYIDAYNIWFRYAKYIYGKDWKCYSKKVKLIRYAFMRIMGVSGVILRMMVDMTGITRVPFVCRYVLRHYASRKVWEEMLSCMNQRSDWQAPRKGF